MFQNNEFAHQMRISCSFLGYLLHTVYLRTLGNSGIWSFAAAGNFQNNIHNFIIGAHRAWQNIIDITYSGLSVFVLSITRNIIISLNKTFANMTIRNSDEKVSDR